jgi:hypothetical protein
MASTATRARVTPWEDRLDAFVYRNRSWLAPPALGVVLVGLAAGAHAMGWQVALAVVAAVMLLLGLDAVTDLPTRSDARWWRRHEERLFGAACWLVGCSWAVWAGWVGVTWSTVAVLAGLSLPLAVLWFKHRRIRRAVDVEKTVRAWGDGTIVGLPGTKLVGVKADMHLVTGTIKGTRGVTHYGAIEATRARIASLLGVQKQQVQIEHSSTGEADAKFTVVQHDPHRDAVTWEPPKPGESIVGAKRIGVFPDGAPIEMSLFRAEHGGVDGLAIGSKGSGKSTYLEVQAAYAAAAPDALLWMVDLKPGAQQFGTWAPVCDWLATTPTEAEQMFRALLRICESRGKAKGRKVKPSRQKPGIVLIFDEASIFYLPEQGGDTSARMAARRHLQDRITLVEQVLAISRSFAVSVRKATQYGIWDAIGGSTIRQHLVAGEVAAFRTAKRADARLVFDLPPGDEIDTAAIPRSRPGTCYMMSAENDRPIQGRLFEITERQVAQLVAEYTGKQPSLEAAAAAAAGPDYANRQRRAPDLAVDVPAEPPLVPGRKRMASAEESRDLVCAALSTLGKPALVRDVAAAAGKSEELTRARLKELCELGRVEQRGTGRWIKYAAIGGGRERDEVK